MPAIEEYQPPPMIPEATVSLVSACTPGVTKNTEHRQSAAAVMFRNFFDISNLLSLVNKI
jgi:hypothetical protein